MGRPSRLLERRYSNCRPSAQGHSCFTYSQVLVKPARGPVLHGQYWEETGIASKPGRQAETFTFYASVRVRICVWVVFSYMCENSAQTPRSSIQSAAVSAVKRGHPWPGEIASPFPPSASAPGVLRASPCYPLHSE